MPRHHSSGHHGHHSSGHHGHHSSGHHSNGHHGHHSSGHQSSSNQQVATSTAPFFGFVPIQTSDNNVHLGYQVRQNGYTFNWDLMTDQRALEVNNGEQQLKWVVGPGNEQVTYQQPLDNNHTWQYHQGRDQNGVTSNHFNIKPKNS